MALAEQAVGTGATDPPPPAKFLNTLGSARWSRYARDRDIDDLQAAIDAWRQAIDFISPSSPEEPVYLNNLAVALSHRFALSNADDDRLSATAAFREACRTGIVVRPE